jgi:hypothetical protein
MNLPVQLIYTNKNVFKKNVMVSDQKSMISRKLFIYYIHYYILYII